MASAYCFGSFELRPNQRQLLANGRTVALGDRAFDVLLALVERAGQLVTKDELLALVWPNLVVEENNLQVHVSALRKVLGAGTIATVAGRGYRFTLEPTDDAGRLSSVDAGPLSVMVLPFQNLTGDAAQGYVADGLTASLTADLSRIRDAFIVNAATAFAYKDKPVTAQQLGTDLGVHFVLQGSVQCSGTKIRVNAQLADATSNAQLWSESFEGDRSDLFALQDQVTTRIGNSIGREMVIVAARKSATHASSPKVADLMLRARALGLKPQSLKILQQMEGFYRQALALDPNNASAMVGLANVLTLQGSNFGYQFDDRMREQKWVECRDLALKAKELDPDNPNIYFAIGFYAAEHDDYEGALRAAKTRLSLEPKNPGAYNNLAVLMIYGGDAREAIKLLIQAIDLDPKQRNDRLLANLGRAYLMYGDNDAAIEWCLKSVETNPSFPFAYCLLAMAYAVKGEETKALAAAAEVRRMDTNLKLSIHQPDMSHPAAYKEYYEKTFVPAWRKAGLPE